MADQTRTQAESKVVTKAMTDPSFKAALLADPKAALESEFGVKLPANLNVNVIQDDPNSATLVLPHSGGQELSEAELNGSIQMSDCWLTCTSCSEWTSFEPGETSGCG
jgi:hypothetical protein